MSLFNILEAELGSGNNVAEDSDSNTCPPRESAGQSPATDAAFPDEGPAGKKTWWNPRTGKKYKDRIKGDGLTPGGMHTRGAWPNPDSPFGDADQARAEGIDLKPWPPDVSENANFAGKGSDKLCTRFAYVHYNLLTYEGPQNLEYYDSKLVECILDCSDKYIKDVIGTPPPDWYGRAGRGTMGRLDGIPNAYYTNGIDYGAHMMGVCKEECMYNLLGKKEKLPPPRYPKGNPAGPGKLPTNPWDPGPFPDIKLTDFTCPPWGVGKVVIISITNALQTESAVPGALGGWNSRGERLRSIHAHSVVAEIVSCGKSGMRVRCYESKYQAPGGMSYVLDIDKNGNAKGFQRPYIYSEWDYTKAHTVRGVQFTAVRQRSKMVKARIKAIRGNQ